MKTFFNFLALIFFIQSYECEEVCYDDLGCFISDKPFGGTILRPIGKLPETPETIDTTFQLFNEKTISGVDFSENELPANYMSSLPTKVIIHGFGNTGKSEWVVKMKDALLAYDNVNVIVVDWKADSGYEQAVANTQVVGAVTANLIGKLMSEKSAMAKDFHLIGFSLGAHTAGYVGKRLKIGRISGLDPAGPYFELTPEEVRLHINDADFVDVIHTNAMLLPFQIGFGILKATGHVDFYPNGGKVQPGCEKINLIGSFSDLLSDFDNTIDGYTCSHRAAVNFFIDSIKEQSAYSAYPCRSYNYFNKGNCNECGSKGCNKMGYWASASKDSGSLYLKTN